MYHNVTIKGSGATGKVKEPVSLYNPTNPKIKEVTLMVQKDAETGRRILTNSYNEYDGRSILEEMDQNQRNFNSYVPPKSDDPDESWRAQTVRPVTRNKIISIAAHVTASIMYPGVFAQNSQDQEDKDAAMVMKDLVEWVIENSNYTMTFIQAVLGALTDPAAITYTEYADVKRKVKEMQDDGTYTVKEIVDEIFSGFQYSLTLANEFFITNAYEPDLQKQRAVARRKLIDYNEAKLKYGHYPNFKYVAPGKRVVFYADTSTFYEQDDTDLDDNLVEEYVYYNHFEDLKLTYISGILLCDPENPNPRLDKKYPFARMIHEMVRNGNFFFGKSAANKLASDQDLIDTMYNMVMDGTFLSLMPPMALYGSEEITASVMVPGTVTTFQDPNTKLDSIAPRSDLRAGLEAIGMIERSMSESSQDNMRSGISQGGERTALEIETLTKNAQVALGLFGRMIGQFVDEIGSLMLSDIVQHLTVAEVSQITSTGGQMAFRSFLLPDKISNGKKVTKKIKFTDEYMNRDTMTEQEKLAESFKVQKEQGGIDSDTELIKINPHLFRELKFKIRQSPDVLRVKNDQLEKALNLEAYDRAIQNPTLDQDVVTQEFLINTYRPGEGDKFKKKQQMSTPQPTEDQAALQQKGVNTNLVSQITGNNSLKRMIGK